MDINNKITKLDNWIHQDNTISKTYSFNSYLEGIKFVEKVALEAEKAGHHPDIVIGYKKVTISLTTHDAGNTVTEKDINLAKEIDNIYL